MDGDVERQIRLAVNAAIERGLLNEVSVASYGQTGQLLQLASPRLVWVAYQPHVHPALIDCFVYPGLEQRQHLPVARALARLSNSQWQEDSLSGRAKRFCQFTFSNIASHVLVEWEGGILRRNSDAHIDPLAALRVVVHGAQDTTAEDLQAAFPGSEDWHAARQQLVASIGDLHLGDPFIDIMLAAYISVHRMHEGLLPFISGSRGPVWLKETSHDVGADLIGLLVEQRDKLRIKVVRAHVATAKQGTLTRGRGGRAPWEAVHAAVGRLCGVPAATAQPGDAASRHEPVAQAISCCVLAAQCGKRPESVPVQEHLKCWARDFARGYAKLECSSLLCLATTHAPSKACIDLLERCGVLLLDSWDLRRSWGALGDIGHFHEIAPFHNSPCTCN